MSPIFTIDIPVLMSVMSALVLAFILGIGLGANKDSVLLKVCQDFSDIMMGVIGKVMFLSYHFISVPFFQN